MDQDTVLLPTLGTFVEDLWEKTRGITAPKFSGVFELLPNQEFQVVILLGKYEIKEGKLDLNVHCFLENSTTGAVLPNSFEKTLQGDLDEYIGFILYPELNTLKFTDENEEGAYHLVLRIHDNNSGEAKEIKQELTFRKDQPNFFQKQESELEEWRQNYYLDPKPTALISYYFKDLEENEALNSDKAILFYVEALNNALFLLEEIEKQLKEDKFTQAQRNGLNILLARSNYEDVDSLGFSAPELKILHELRDEFYNVLEKEISHPSELDMIWSLFFANGKYENIDKIISTLYYKKDISEADLDGLSQEDLLKYAIGSAAAWSLETIGSYHPMVQVYIIYTINQPTTSPYLKDQLKTILERINKE